MELSSSIVLCFSFIMFIHVFIIFTNFSDPHIPTLASGSFIEADTQQMMPNNLQIPKSLNLKLKMQLFFVCVYI